MTLAEYIQWTTKTWANAREFTFSDQLNCVLGIVGEIGEFRYAPQDMKIKEAGDAFYYCCRLLQALGLAVKTSSLLSMCCTSPFDSSGDVGRLCEYYKKALRGDWDVDPLTVKTLILPIMWKILEGVTPVGATPSEILERIITANVEKLEGRLSRGTICGSGEDR